MRIQTPDGRVFEGTKVQIIEQMRSLSFGPPNETLAGYIDRSVEQARSLFGVELKVNGKTDEERAESMFDALISAELIVRFTDEVPTINNDFPPAKD